MLEVLSMRRKASTYGEAFMCVTKIVSKRIFAVRGKKATMAQQSSEEAESIRHD